jgi:Uma2 family endonuclease
MVAEQEPRPRLITVDEFHRMWDAGIFDDGERIELLDGELIWMPPPSPPHSESTDRIVDMFYERFRKRARIGTQRPILLDGYSEPQPDIVLSRDRGDEYYTRHPGPGDVLLVVEVSLSSLRHDRGRKLHAYARSGIAEVWIVDLVHRRVEVYAELRDGAYAVTRIANPGDSVAPSAFPADAIPVASFLPPGPIVPA